MFKHLRITVDGKPYDVVVEDVTEEPGGTLYPSPGTMAQAVHTAAPPATTPTAGAAPAASAPAPAAGGGDNDKLAPLGGVVIEIDVRIGDTVKAGDKIMTIEAMKMKTAVSAHRDGSVKNIPVKVGDAVDAGQVLMTIG
ncbi:MAG: biotin/lipoyl-containing protein [Rhodospirillales bacterium]